VQGQSREDILIGTRSIRRPAHDPVEAGARVGNGRDQLRYQLAQINVSLSTDNLKWFAEQLKLLNPDLRMPTIPYR
jgi:hypothetical protein